MAKLKLQAEVLSALEHAELLNFSAAQRAVVSTIKSGQNKWLIAPDLSPLRVAVASQFRIIEDPENISGIDAQLVFKESKEIGPPELQSLVANNGTPDASVPIKITGTSNSGAVATIPNGLTNVNLFLSGADSDQTLQVFTRDGRQIAGTELPEDLQISLLSSPANGFDPGATYSADYLNVGSLRNHLFLVGYFVSPGRTISIHDQWNCEPYSGYSADQYYTQLHRDIYVFNYTLAQRMFR